MLENWELNRRAHLSSQLDQLALRDLRLDREAMRERQT
jgi:hypothetical protein